MTTAAEAMEPEFCGTMGCEGLVERLLAQTPDGEPVVILADGTLARLEHSGDAPRWPSEETMSPDPYPDHRRFRLVSLTGEP